MKKVLSIVLLSLAFFSCEREIEEPLQDFGLDYQPLEVGLFWIYSVDQTIYFGENDFESSQFFYKDRIRTFFINEEDEQVFVLDRLKSMDGVNWVRESSFTRQIRDLTLLENQENQILISLVFPPETGKVWDGNTFRAENPDEYEIVDFLNLEKGARTEPDLIRVLQNEADDQITFRDNRYEIFARGVGLVEKYAEVLTYCSRNDCLGDQLINSGEITLMTLTDYGRE
ncbi:hypothetical protein [Algoriphagus namhaensis]